MKTYVDLTFSVPASVTTMGTEWIGSSTRTTYATIATSYIGDLKPASINDITSDATESVDGVTFGVSTTSNLCTEWW